jgi:hypothetical protein
MHDRGERHPLAQQPLMALAGKVGHAQRALGAHPGAHLDHAGVDVVEAQRAGHRHAMVAVAHEVHLAHAVDVDGGKRISATHRAGDALPPRAHLARGGAEGSIEASRTIDGPDDGVEGDDLLAEVALAGAPQRGHHLLEGQDQMEVPGTTPHPAGQP